MAKNHVGEQLYNRLLQDILDGTYQVGERLPSEVSLQEKYGASRNTIRSVLQRLNAIGVLETRHGSGTYVKRVEEYSYIDQIVPVTLSATSDLVNIMELRKAIDISAAYSAALNATAEDIVQIEKSLRTMTAYAGHTVDTYADSTLDFHVRVAYASHNNILIQLVELVKHITSAQMADFIFKCGIDPGSDFYHSMVLECIKARHPKEAAYMMEQHMEQLVERVREYVKLYPGYRSREQ